MLPYYVFILFSIYRILHLLLLVFDDFTKLFFGCVCVCPGSTVV